MAIKDYTKIDPCKIANLHIIDKEDPQELIKNSNLIIAINSTALIESRILGKKTAVPVFYEASRELYDYIYLKKYFNNELIKLNSLEDFINTIKESVKINFSFNKINNNNFVTDYIGFFDKNHAKRYSDKIQDLIK